MAGELWEQIRRKSSLTDTWKQIAMGTGRKVRKVMPKGQKNIKVKKDWERLRQEEKKKEVKTKDVKQEVLAGIKTGVCF